MKVKQNWYAVMTDLRVVYVGFFDKKPKASFSAVTSRAAYLISDKGLHKLQDALAKAQRQAYKLVAGNATVLEANLRDIFTNQGE